MEKSIDEFEKRVKINTLNYWLDKWIGVSKWKEIRKIKGIGKYETGEYEMRQEKITQNRKQFTKGMW